MDPSYTNKAILANQNVKKSKKGLGRIIIALLLIVAALFMFWPDDKPKRKNLIEEAKKSDEISNEALEVSKSLVAKNHTDLAKAADSANIADKAKANEPFGEVADELIESETPQTNISDAESLERKLPATIKGIVKRGDSLSICFARYDLNENMAQQIVQALKKHFNFRQLKPQMKWELKLDVMGKIKGFTLFADKLVTYYARNEGDGLQGYKITGKTEMYVVPIAGKINHSLAMSVWRLGEGKALTAMISALFAWDIDFYSDVQKGDEWYVLVEKHYYNGKFINYGRILCAKFFGTGFGDKYAYYFDSGNNERSGYYDDSGFAVRKNFLRAPLDTTRVTSKYGFRLHPVSGKYKKHNGIDYGAARGTPIWSIAKGRVIKSGWMGTCGKGVKLKHDNGYESVYCHMSKISVKKGQKVKQKTMLGRVGCTGSCTGPHLHFGLIKNGRHINPAKVKFVPGKRLERKYRDRWKEARELLHKKLDNIEVPEFYGPKPHADFVAPVQAIKVKQKKSVKAQKARPKRKKTKSKGFRPRPEGIHEAG